ncbi:gamma-glutamylcyclotransferase [Rosenbergiella epipactidis]|uniref:gamma-glutamylcyclotransferase family protein n=1 Tax=Rosenbergiella epipactidis TaxID=1544694 RepID=UPI002025F9F4|nr:gamma-glutamylcyclotransferase [Rosenbergiella epipactidis]MCL9667642.1 gamma-glutamylcyclotransferase [Rosenbergiella epipactidis]
METLFVYGTLGPDRPNAHIMENIGGTWIKGSVEGTLEQKGWGAEMGYPGIILDKSGNRVHGFLFSSANLASNWKILDDFEGDEYERVPVEVTTELGDQVVSSIYMLKS